MLVGVLLVAASIEAFRGAAQLSRLLAEGHKSGELIDVASLAPAIPSVDENAAIPLLALTNELRAVNDLLRKGPPLWRFDEKRRLRSLSVLESWEADRSSVFDEAATNRWSDFEREFTMLAPLVDRVQSALKRPKFQSGFDYHRGFKESGLVPLLVERARVGELLAYSFVRQARAGNEALAKARLDALLRWGELQRGDGLIISEMFRYRCLEKAIRAARHGLRELSWSDDELARMQSRVENWDLIDGILQAYQLERAMNLDFLHAAAHDANVREHQLELWRQIEDGIGAGFMPSPGLWMRRVRLPLWSMIWWRQESARSLRQWNLMIGCLKETRGRSLREVNARWHELPHRHPELFLERDELEGLDRWRFVFESDFTFMEGVPTRVLKLETERQLLLTAVALKRYHQRKGDVPGNLNGLASAFLEKLPVDAMDGQPIRYQRTGVGTFVLYSVGEDGVDQGGDTRPTRTNAAYADVWDGRDVVWPTSAPRESIQGAGKGTAR